MLRGIGELQYIINEQCPFVLGAPRMSTRESAEREASTRPKKGMGPVAKGRSYQINYLII